MCSRSVQYLHQTAASAPRVHSVVAWTPNQTGGVRILALPKPSHSWFGWLSCLLPSRACDAGEQAGQAGKAVRAPSLGVCAARRVPGRGLAQEIGLAPRLRFLGAVALAVGVTFRALLVLVLYHAL